MFSFQLSLLTASRCLLFSLLSAFPFFPISYRRKFCILVFCQIICFRFPLRSYNSEVVNQKIYWRIRSRFGQVLHSLNIPLVSRPLAKTATSVLLTPFTRYRSHSMQDSPPQSGMKIHLLTRYRYYFTSDLPSQSGYENQSVHMIPFSFHIRLVSYHFQSVFITKRKNGRSILDWCILSKTRTQTDTKRKRCRVNRRPIRYEVKTVSCRQTANPIRSENGVV